MTQWIDVKSSLPPDDGWYLVTWKSVNGELFIDYSAYSKSGWFEDRWGSNADAIAWTFTPKFYEGVALEKPHGGVCTCPVCCPVKWELNKTGKL